MVAVKAIMHSEAINNKYSNKDVSLFLSPADLIVWFIIFSRAFKDGDYCQNHNGLSEYQNRA